VYKPPVAFLVSHILADSMARIRGFGLATPFNFPFPVAVKTGTSNNWRDNWAVGFTPYVTVGVWVGNFDGRPMHNVSGATGAGPVFRQVMLAVMQKRPKHGFDRGLETGTAGSEVFVTARRICPLSGMRAGPDCPHRVWEIFLPGTEPKKRCTYHQTLPIDKRNGLMAGPGCHRRYVQRKPFVIYPPLYADWAKTHGVGQLPTRYSPHCPRRGARFAIRPTVLAPADRTRYLMDPSRPRKYQTVTFKAAVHGTVDAVTWLVNGKVLGKVEWPYTAQWKLRPGAHVIAVKADGRQSRPVEITVE
jgi:penicillin-binding protein 1C